MTENFVFNLFCVLFGLHLFLVSVFRIAYRLAGDKFVGKMSELFLVLSDSAQPVSDDADGFQVQPPARGQKHRREDDQMSVESDSKRPDVSTSAEKTRNKFSKSSRGKPKNKN